MSTGLQSTLKVKKESTYATRPTAVAYLSMPFKTESLQKKFTRAQSENLANTAGVASIATLGTFVEGDITCDITYENIDWLLYGVCGAIVTTGASPPYTNRITPSTSLPSFHIEMDRGNVPAGKIRRYTGMMVSTASLNFSATAMPSATFGLVGQNEASATGGDTADATADTSLYTGVVSPAEATVWDIGTGGSTAYCLKAATINIDRGLRPDRFCLGSQTTLQPLPTSKMLVTGSFTIELGTDTDFYEDFREQDDLVAQLTFVGPVLGGGTYSMIVYLNKLRYDAPSVPQVVGPGPLDVTINFTGYGTGGSGVTSEPIAFDILNGIDDDTAI